MTNQQVHLLQSPDNLLKIIYTACKTCTSSESPIEIFNEGNKLRNSMFLTNCMNYELKDTDCGFDVDWCNSKNEECNYCIQKDEIQEYKNKQLSLVKKVIESGHLSTVEHINFTFSISGVSRALSHQLVRHRHASFSQQSQRYVTEKEQFGYIIPESIKKLEDKQNEIEYFELMAQIQGLYDYYISMGILAEDARYILPNACTTSLTMTLNLRELIHIANERLCSKAQWEIRELVQKMCDLVIKKESWLAEYLQPKCVKNGKCTEIKSCGKY